MAGSGRSPRGILRRVGGGWRGDTPPLPNLVPIWPQLGRYMALTWPQLGPTLPNLPPNWPQLGPKLVQLGPNLAPTWPNLAKLLPTWPNLAPTWLHFEAKNRCPRALWHGFLWDERTSTIFVLKCCRTHYLRVRRPLGRPSWPHFGPKLVQLGPKMVQLGPNFLQLGPNLAPT